MIEYAQTTYDTIPNLSFEQCFAEDFITIEKCDIAVSIFCLHWLEDKQKVFENINNSLEIDGEFFGTIFSASDPVSVGIIVLQELLQKPECNFLNNITITEKDSLLRYVISDEECKDILQKTGFELISYEKKSPFHTFKNRDELAAFQRPLRMRLPLFQSLPETEREWLFNKYIDLFLTRLKKDENDHYIYQGTTTTIIHARKVADHTEKS
jgi:SAM-dependent methyltransferase